MVQTFGQESRNAVCCVYFRRYEWDVVLHGVSIAADRVVCSGGFYILGLFYRQCRSS